MEKSLGKTYTLDAALHSTKKTETTLQNLLKGISDGTGFYHREVEEEEKIEPQLAHEIKSKDLAEEYMKEEVPIVRSSSDISKRKKLKEETEEPGPITPDTEDAEGEKVQTQEIVEKPPVSEEVKILEKEEKKEEVAELEEEVVEKSPMDDVYSKLTIFFEEYQKSANERYNLWENQVSNILAILRKMRKITQKNTEELVKTINESYKNVQEGLDLFKQKRDEVEKVADVDLQSMSGEFRKVLGLLELQVKEYRLKKLTDEYFHTVEGI